MRGLGICSKVVFRVATLEFEADFITLDLGTADIILGVQWLRTLGKCQMDWKTHELSFLHNGKTVTLHGDPSLHTTKLSLKSLIT